MTAHRQLVYLVEGLRAEGAERLPPERELAEELGISRGSLRKELDHLVEQGRIERRRGRSGGSFIRAVEAAHYIEPLTTGAPFTVRRSLNAVVGVPTFLTDQGFEPSTRILRTEEREAGPRDRDLLGLGRKERVVMIRRLRSADDIPLSLEEMVLPAAVFPDILKRDLGSIYRLMAEHFATPVTRADEQIGIGQASASAAYLLGVEPGAALFDIERIARDATGRAIEASRDLFRSDITRLTVSSG